MAAHGGMGAHAVGGGFGGRGFGGRGFAMGGHGGARAFAVRGGKFARFHRGFRSFAFYGGPAYAYSDYYSDYGCWQWYPGRSGYVRVWVC
jgi:hypothetical protein